MKTPKCSKVKWQSNFKSILFFISYFIKFVCLFGILYNLFNLQFGQNDVYFSIYRVDFLGLQILFDFYEQIASSCNFQSFK